MSAIAKANGWRGFDGLAHSVQGGYEYQCDGMPTPMGCGEFMTTTRQWTRVGVKKSGWLVCYGLEDGGAPDTDVVLTFCPRCAAVVQGQDQRRVNTCSTGQVGTT